MTLEELIKLFAEGKLTELKLKSCYGDNTIYALVYRSDFDNEETCYSATKSIQSAEELVDMIRRVSK